MSLEGVASGRAAMPDTGITLGTHGIVSKEEFLTVAADFVARDGLTLALEIVAACSLRCPGCWVAMARPEMWRASPSDLMSPALFEAALALGRLAGARRLTLLGGEPTLHPCLPELVRFAIDRGYAVSVTTNGVTSSARLESVLASGIAGVSFSVDGSRPEIHDTLRPSASGRSTFGRTLDSIRRSVSLRDRFRYVVCVNHAIYPANLADAESMVRLSADLGVDMVRLHFTMPGDLPELDGGTAPLDPQRWAELVTRLPEIEQETGVRMSAVEGYGAKAQACARRTRSPYLTVQPHGGILTCAAYARLPERRRHTIGCLREDGRVELNPDFPTDRSQQRERICCGAIPMVLAGMPATVRAAIEQAGGLGCIFLRGPLASA